MTTGTARQAPTRGAPSREAEVNRETAETKISVTVNLDGSGSYDHQTGVGFFDHMLDQLAKHGGMDCKISAEGDLHIDDHHTVEDVGIALGAAIKQAMGDKAGIHRYAHCYLPMDEALTRCALDLSNRPFLVWDVTFKTQKIGTFDVELVREFFQALAQNAGITLHITTLYGENSHHIAESIFKAVAKALKHALSVDPTTGGALPSTKGAL